MEESNRGQQMTLVVRKPAFGLPTACPSCLPVYIYLRFARIPFQLDYNLSFPDSDQIPYVEFGTSVVFDDEKGGVIEALKEDGIVDLDTEVNSLPEWISTKAMVCSWLADAIMYELWVGSDGSSAHKIYYSDLPWPIGKSLYLKQVRDAKRLLRISEDNLERREAEIYRRANNAYQALSTRLGDDPFFFENRATSLDAAFLAHVLFMLHALPETSVLRGKLLNHDNLVKYAEKHKAELLEAGSFPSISTPVSDPSSSVPRQGASNWSSKPKRKPKREKTEEQKTFRRRAKYFLVTQMVAILLFLSLLGGYDNGEVEADGDDGGDYE